MKAILQRLILNAEKEVSWAKLGTWIFAIAGLLLSQHVLPASYDVYLKIILTLSGVTGGIGIRDAFDPTIPSQSTPPVPPTDAK